MTKYAVTGLGEGLLRYSVPPGERLEAAPAYLVHVGGAEVNVIAALAGLGVRTAWVSGLPDTAIGRRITAALRAAGADAITTPLDGRVGAYFFQPGTGGLPAQVTYDRAGSAFTRMTPAEVRWDALLDTRWLHTTGITAAVSDAGRALVAEAVMRARAAGVCLSVDVNYRRALWTPEAARAALLPIITNSDLLLCGTADAETVFGTTGEPEQIVRALADLTGARRIVTSRSDQGVTAWEAGDILHQPAYAIGGIVDRVGAGDALAAGILFGLTEAVPLDSGLRYGAALAAIKLGQVGDHLTVTRAELDGFLAGVASSGAIKR